MSDKNSTESILDIYIFETAQNIEQLEALVLESDKSEHYLPDTVNEIFRIMHTIKGSSAMMSFNNVSAIAHSIEDLFYYLREQKPHNIEYSELSDLVLSGIDFIKAELVKIKTGDNPDDDPNVHISNIRSFLQKLKGSNEVKDIDIKPEIIQNTNCLTYKNPEGINTFKAVIFFEDGCEMENLRAFGMVHDLEEQVHDIIYYPADMDNDGAIKIIREHGFIMFLKTDKTYQEINDLIMQETFLKSIELTLLQNDNEVEQFTKAYNSINNITLSISEKPNTSISIENEMKKQPEKSSVNSIISINVDKLDKLMDLMGELVIAESMVTQNPDLRGLELNNFSRASAQLHKITIELQNMVMSTRMVPLSGTFIKMNRLVRDMSKKQGKEIELILDGEDTEVDKNIIEHISDPLMHLIRNSIDHGIEKVQERENAGKPGKGTIILSGKNDGSDVIILVKDDGRGLNKEKILQKAKANDLLTKPELEMTDDDIYNLIFLPGFSTNDAVTEYSGRGVGMDVVVKNIENVGGKVFVQSSEGLGTTVTLKIPLTLAIIDGMNIQVGQSHYTIPTMSIKESFSTHDKNIIIDPEGNEMIMVRGNCYPILRLNELFNVTTDIKNFENGIMVMVEQEGKTICIFADKLLGRQEVVVKALPGIIKNRGKIHGLSGCTLLGNGSISLILDIGALIDNV